VIDDLFLRKLPSSANDELADVLMSRYEKLSTVITSNRPIEDWLRLLGDILGHSVAGPRDARRASAESVADGA
jgi:DNA replication protein DnaC